MKTMLRSLGLHVEVAPDGETAVEMAAAKPYALILMDIQMPGMDGLEATRAIRRQGGLSIGAPIVAMTANAFIEDREACLAAGMNDHMPKPVEGERLCTMLLNWMPERETHVEPA